MDGIRAIDHSDTSPIAIDQDDYQQPGAAPPSFPGGFLDEVKDLKLEAVFELIKKRVADKYELGDIKGLEARGFAKPDQYPTQPQPTSRLTLPELAKEVFDFLLDKQAKTTATITDKEAVNKLLAQLEGGGAVPGPRAYISVLGRYNVGKSTLLNALLSFDVLPTSQDAETAVTVFVQHQDIEIPELCKMSDGEVLRRGAENIKTYLEEIQQKVREKELSKNLIEYLVRLPIPCFTRMQESKTMAITPLLVDTPGSNEVSQDDLRKLADLNLRTTTAYIYVMSFNELRNQHDYTAFQHIQERDEAIFNEGRIAIVVTKMDESYRAVKKDDRKLTEPKVKEIVSSGIQKTLKLEDVSPGIVYPLSGEFAFQARVARSDSEIVDVMRTSWGNMKRATLGHQAFSIAGSMTSQQLCEDLEMSSQISSVENKIRLMIDQLDALWKKSIASSCYLYIKQALETLDETMKRVGHQMAAFKATVDQCRDIKRHHEAITKSLTSRTEFIKQLEDSYAADTDTDKMLSGKFSEHLDSFMKTVRTKIKAGNYTPTQLKADLDVIHEEATEKLTHLCWQTTFNRCQQTLVSRVVIMTDKYGRMRNALSEVCRQASRNESLPQKSRPIPDCVENRVRDAPPRLDQIPKQEIKVSVGRWLGYAACKLLFGLPHIQLIKEEALGPIKEDIKSVVRNQHREFFKERKDSVVLHFFVQYCEEIINLMDTLFDEYYNCPVELSNIADQAHSELKEKEELQDQYRQWEKKLKKWKTQMTLFHEDLLPQKDD